MCTEEAVESKFGRRRHYDICEHLIKMGIKCTQDINPECAKDSYSVYTSLSMRYWPGYPHMNESCIHQKFDEYFNQNGMCSFQDLQE